MLVGAEVVDPHLLRRGLLGAGLAHEEEHVGLDSLGVEDARRQAQERVDVALVQELSTDRLPGAALEEHVVGDDDGGAAVSLVLLLP